MRRPARMRGRPPGSRDQANGGSGRQTEPGHLAQVDAKTEAFLWRGLLEHGINVGVARRTRDMGVDRDARETQQKARCHPTSHQKKRPGSTGQTSGHAPALVLRGWAIGPSTVQGIRSPAADAVCPKSGRFVTSSIAIGLLCTADVAVQAGIECVKQGRLSGKTLMNMSARACAELGGSASSSSATGAPAG